MQITLGTWTEDRLNQIMSASSQMTDPGARIAYLSGHFLGIEYKDSTLAGDANTPEEIVVNLEGVDCFTFIDYIVTMRLSDTFSEFRENLKRVRYRSGEVAFEKRNHFFSDWSDFNSDLVEDVTEQIGGERTGSSLKKLNEKEDGTLYLSGVQPRQREIKYIPSDAIDEAVFSRLRNGDYAGIYTEVRGLDVSHVGILIKEDYAVFLRHASSREKKVIDENFRAYISDKPGIVVLRPRDIS